MAHYDQLPLFPLHAVLFPDMHLPLYIFEPRYREMIRHCREEGLSFGIVLLQQGVEIGGPAIPSQIGTIARLTQCEDLPDGSMNIVAVGETRFGILETHGDKSYLTARVAPLLEDKSNTSSIRPTFETVARLFKVYLKELLAVTNRPLSALQLPHDPENLSYAVASMLQIPLAEKQYLLELKNSESRLRYEIDLLAREIEAQRLQRDSHINVSIGRSGVIKRVNAKDMSRLSSLN